MYELFGMFCDRINFIRFTIIIIRKIYVLLYTRKVVVQSRILLRTCRSSTVLEVQYVLYVVLLLLLLRW